jgi:peptide/nickel transport system substrate-binding protein/oligopeptide transport system substrate-binding protein
MAEPRDPGAFLRLTAFADHPEPPRLDEVLFQIYPEDANREQRWQDLLDGQLHLAAIPPGRIDEAIETFGSSRDGYEGPGLLDGITTTVYLYGFDTTREPFDDPVVRRAISMAIDREALADEVMLGSRVAATSIVPPPLPGTPGVCEHCSHDPDGAAELLAEAEIELEGFTLTHNRGRTHAAIAEHMAGDLEAALDIEVDLAARDLQPLIQAVRRGEIPVFRLGWDANEPDASAFLYPLFHSSQVGLDNLTRYEDEDVDELLERSRTTMERPIALGANRDAERAILADAPAIPLLWYRHNHVVTGEVRELYYSPLGRIGLSQVWIDPDA